MSDMVVACIAVPANCERKVMVSLVKNNGIKKDRRMIRQSSASRWRDRTERSL